MKNKRVQQTKQGMGVRDMGEDYMERWKKGGKLHSQSLPAQRELQPWEDSPDGSLDQISAVCRGGTTKSRV